MCGTAAPNPRGIPRDARSPAHGAPGPVPVRSRFRDMGRSFCRASGRKVPFPHPQRRVRDGSHTDVATGRMSGIGVADEDFTSVDAALPVVEKLLVGLTRRVVLFTSVIRKRSTVYARTENSV